MGEQLRTATQGKQTCAICLQTIRKNAVWWHVTECRHYFHYDCWHTYHKHECDRREGDHTRVRCPACRHPQISKAQFLAVMVPLMRNSTWILLSTATMAAASKATKAAQSAVRRDGGCIVVVVCFSWVP